MNPANLTPCVGCPDNHECWIRTMLDVKECSGEYADFPTASQHRMAITSAIPYHWRWQINNLKLMLGDLKDLHKKHEVVGAEALYTSLQDEAELLVSRMIELVDEQQRQREKVVK